MKSSTVLSNSGHDRLRNSVLFSRRSRAIRTRSVHAPQPSSFRLCQRHVFWKVCAAFFHRKIRHVKMRQVESRISSGDWRVKKKGFFFRRSCCAWISQHKGTRAHSVRISSPNRTTDLREEHSQVQESNDGSMRLSDAAHQQCKSTARV